MSATTVQLDKSVETPVQEGYGTISIRVVVLAKGMAASPSPPSAGQAPADAAPDEMLPETDKRPVSTFLEEPKRGHQVCVFLINGQRQHAWDNQFIVRDLELKYLRNRMLAIVDCDGLRPEAIAELMQGSRNQFFEGKVYFALEARVLATLKGDPDLARLEEEAEDEISNLEAGDEAVKDALDQLIEAHHDAAAHFDHGHNEAGEASRQDRTGGGLEQTQAVVVEGQPNLGAPGSDPILQLRPDVATIRLHPNEARRLAFEAKPDTAWKDLESLALTFDPPVKELQVVRSAQIAGEEVTLTFAEPDQFDDDEYPIETTLQAVAAFKGSVELRFVERRVVIMPKKPAPPKPTVQLKDDPTFVKVTSRQPIRFVLGGPDLHVRLRWDGKDELLGGSSPAWSFRTSCESPSVEPLFFTTRPVDGRFELLMQGASGLASGEQLKFDMEAVGPGKTLSTAFLVHVVDPPSPRKMTAKLRSGAQRRPPYQLVYVKREHWANTDLNCFGQPWSGEEAGSFDPPSAKNPLLIFINTDMDLLATYRESLLSRKLAETTIQQRVNKYTAHVAYHLYQIFQKKRQAETQPDGSADLPTEGMQRNEIRRVAHTLIRLMEVTQ